jgi:HPt (histidine-containing phosphotransfer) domain-containing protein
VTRTERVAAPPAAADPARAARVHASRLSGEAAAGEIEALQAAGAAGDIAAIVRPAHSLKSNAANVGATVLGDLCRALEVDARAGDVPDMATRIEAVETEFRAVSAALLTERAGG